MKKELEEENETDIDNLSALAAHQYFKQQFYILNLNITILSSPKCICV